MRSAPLILGVLALVLLLAWQFPYAAASTDQKLRIAYLVALLALIGGGWRLRQGSASRNLASAAAWLAIVLALVLAYSFRGDIGPRLMGELMPDRVQAAPGGTLVVHSGEGGHFHLVAEVNGAPVRFMIDTGASDIVLSPGDAARAGFDVPTLNYTRVYGTANGMVRGAPVIIDTLAIGGVTMHDLPASVNGTEMDGSLLGMTFLRRFSAYSVNGNTLTLTP